MTGTADKISSPIAQHVIRGAISLVVMIVGILVTTWLTPVLDMQGMMREGSAPDASAVQISVTKHGITMPLTEHEKRLLPDLLHHSDITDHLCDVVGLDEIIYELQADVVLPLRQPAVFFHSESKHLLPTRGVLLEGPPGTGKTMLSRTIAKEAGCNLLLLSAASLEDKWFGESNKMVSAAFSLARKAAPCVVFLDEIDGMLRRRADDDPSCVYSMKTEFLASMDALLVGTPAAVVVVGATNNVAALDPAVRRRLPTVYHIGAPSPLSRWALLCQLVPALHQSASDVRKTLLERTEGFTGDDLKNMVAVAGRRARRASTRQLMSADLLCDVAQVRQDLLAHQGKLGAPDLLAVLQGEEAPASLDAVPSPSDD